MNALQELKALLAQATTDHVKALLQAEIAKLEAEAKAAIEAVESHAVEEGHSIEEALVAKIRAMIAAVRKVL